MSRNIMLYQKNQSRVSPKDNTFKQLDKQTEKSLKASRYEDCIYQIVTLGKNLKRTCKKYGFKEEIVTKIITGKI